jgi:hypothetical protein
MTELNRVERAAGTLNDAASREILRRYAREIESDLVCCAKRPQPALTI